MYSAGKWAVAAGVVCMLVGSAVAQPPRGGRGGFGGRGGDLLDNASVQKELKLSDDQISKIKEVSEEVRSKHKEDFAKLRDLDPMDRREKSQELMKTVGEERRKALAGILKPEQEKRLKQIRLQTEGARAFLDPEVEKDLKLTDDQKASIKTINDDARKEMEGVFGGGRGQGNFEEARKKMAEVRKDSLEKATAVLTDTQKKEWKELTGEPFQVQFERREGGRPGGGRRPQRD